MPASFTGKRQGRDAWPDSVLRLEETGRHAADGRAPVALSAPRPRPPGAGSPARLPCGPYEDGCLQPRSSAGHTMRPFTPGGSGGAWPPPRGCPAGGWPYTSLLAVWKLKALSLSTAVRETSELTLCLSHRSHPEGESLGARACPHPPRRGGPRPQLNRGVVTVSTRSPGEPAGSPLSLDTLPGSPAARQARRETVATKNNPPSV